MARYDMKKTGALRDAIRVAQRRHRTDQACRVKAGLLSNVSHEIRTPMNAIIGLSGLALQHEMSEKVQDYLVKIKKSSEHLLGIINDVLDFSALEAGKPEVAYVTFQIQDVINDVVNRVALQVEDKGLELLCSIEPHVPDSLLGDPLTLRRILSIYANNAVKFSPRGQVHIRVGVQYQTNTAVMLRIAVSDTGIGISEDQVPLLFQSFSQVDSSSTRPYGGMGLGLAIAQRLVDAMGGEVGVESSLGKGSTFWFTVQLGAVQDPSAHTRADKAAAQDTGLLTAEAKKDTDAYPARMEAVPSFGQLKGARVLLVEDNALNQQVAYELLTNAGLVVDIAEDGQQAVNQVQAQELRRLPYDLVLMDLQMPVMDGLTATRLIRMQKAAETLPIVALTANTTQADQDNCHAAGMNGFLAKPVMPALLWETLLRCLGSRQSPAKHEAKHPVPPSRHALGATQSAKLPDRIEGLDLKRGMALMGNNESLYLKTLQTFVASQADAIKDIRYLLHARDLPTAERQVHTLIGQAGYLGATPLHRAAQELEVLLVAERVDKVGLEQALQAAARQLSIVVDAVHHAFPNGLLSPTERVDAVPLAPAQLAMLIREMQRLAQSNDPSALDLLDRNRSALQRHLGSQLPAIEQALQDFDFEVAAKLLRRQ